jgi:hypothetical protein
MANSAKPSIWAKLRNHLRRFWRQSILRWWHDYQWPVIGSIWLIALALGYIGFTKYFTALGEKRSPWDNLYLALQLFILESGSVSVPVSWELEVARLLAPATAAYTAIQALTLLFYEQLQLLRVHFIKNHVVICGLSRKGLLLAKGYHERGERVVVIEQDEENPLLQECREQGAIVLIGNAANRELLRKARVHKGNYLVSVCGDDGANAEVAIHACELVERRKDKPLTCFIHIVDPRLCNLLRERELFSEKVESFRLQLFNVYDSGARAVLNQYPIFNGTSASQNSRPHIVIVGLGSMGQSLLVHAARSWQAERSSTSQKLRVTIIDKIAEEKKELLCLKYPQLADVCDLIPRQMDIYSPQFHKADFLFDSSGHCEVTSIYICVDNDSLGLYAGIVLLQQLRDENVPIVVRMIHNAGLAKLLQGVDGQSSAFKNLHAFGLLDSTCAPDLVLGGTNEIIARAIHESYVRHQEDLGHTPETNPSMVPWDELPEELKESNRRQADHVCAKLKAVGCGIKPLTDWNLEHFKFTPEEIELMAEMEHERFVEERLSEGWSYAPGPKNLDKKTSPYLIPWDQLPEDIKEYDRNTVRELPGFLAKAGFQIYRVK